MFGFFRKKTAKEKMDILECKIAAMEKELEVLWKIELEGWYVFGKRSEIISIEKDLAYKKKQMELLKI